MLSLKIVVRASSLRVRLRIGFHRRPDLRCGTEAVVHFNKAPMVPTRTRSYPLCLQESYEIKDVDRRVYSPRRAFRA